MEEQLISFNTAVLAKEKGFIEQCYNWYNDEKLCIGRQARNGIALPHSNNESRGLYDSIYISAPTQSLLQKWLRDKHYIDIVIIPDTIKVKIYTISIFKQYRVNKNHIERCVEVVNYREKGKIITYTNYEKALEVALVEALNLI